VGSGTGADGAGQAEAVATVAAAQRAT